MAAQRKSQKKTTPKPRKKSSVPQRRGNVLLEGLGKHLEKFAKPVKTK